MAAGLIGLLFVALTAVAGGGAQASAKADKPSVVLVHGAFADSSSWNGVIERLQRHGYPVVAVANPLRGLGSDAAYLKRALGAVSGPIVLVGHSYGGQVMSGAATGNPNVKALVYIAAFAPAEGESALELSNKYPGSTLGGTLQSTPLGDGSNDLSIQQDKYRGQFAADVSRQQAELAAVTQRPIRDKALTEPAGPPAWQTVPSWFLIPTGDKNIPAEAQRFMAERAHAKAVVEVPKASHAVAVSEPHKVADLIEQAAETVH
jgi:pimeloyl-ACP methyl ester carboxylesterase